MKRRVHSRRYHQSTVRLLPADLAAGRHARSPGVWHVETFPTRADAEEAKSEHSAVVEEFDKVWLLPHTTAAPDWKQQGLCTKK